MFLIKDPVSLNNFVKKLEAIDEINGFSISNDNDHIMLSLDEYDFNMSLKEDRITFHGEIIDYDDFRKLIDLILNACYDVFELSRISEVAIALDWGKEFSHIKHAVSSYVDNFTKTVERLGNVLFGSSYFTLRENDYDIDIGIRPAFKKEMESGITEKRIHILEFEVVIVKKEPSKGDVTDLIDKAHDISFDKIRSIFKLVGSDYDEE
ncbi:hypothetical protein [Natranaerobius thermophilus]|uniref:Uncharacterized protein n=1 Tax=Natranaerobius thermophilus (strain ATCC BAA-1301 / DSM 18059 / JW/NM-WN-LF) TaxID=457570 RepID=B2A6L5_NATTJ|nr:hypothetical protein [Natranaerobius thermophilus]ACB85548.1 hypothetical protein Nther_1979 [Natranaerobius thermophilus JW/NM-WN-LF]